MKGARLWNIDFKVHCRFNFPAALCLKCTDFRVASITDMIFGHMNDMCSVVKTVSGSNNSTTYTNIGCVPLFDGAPPTKPPKQLNTWRVHHV